MVDVAADVPCEASVVTVTVADVSISVAVVSSGTEVVSVIIELPDDMALQPGIARLLSSLNKKASRPPAPKASVYPATKNWRLAGDLRSKWFPTGCLHSN